MYCLRVNVMSPKQIPMHILMSLANNLPCNLASLYPFSLWSRQGEGLFQQLYVLVMQRLSRLRAHFTQWKTVAQGEDPTSIFG